MHYHCLFLQLVPYLRGRLAETKKRRRKNQRCLHEEEVGALNAIEGVGAGVLTGVEIVGTVDTVALMIRRTATAEVDTDMVGTVEMMTTMVGEVEITAVTAIHMTPGLLICAFYQTHASF